MINNNHNLTVVGYLLKHAYGRNFLVQGLSDVPRLY